MIKYAFLKKPGTAIAVMKLQRIWLAACFLSLLFSVAQAQTPGLIYKPSSTAAGRSVLDPNGDGYVSATNAGFGATDYGSASENQMISVPLMISEPAGDLSTGASNGHTEIVSFNGGNSVFVLKKKVGGVDYFIIRFRISKASTARKGYSLLIDTDNQFGNVSNSNPGFEKEIVLETGAGVKIYTHNVSAGTFTYLAYDLEEHHQRSVAASTNGGDPDYLYDFYVPYADLGLSGNVRFAATTITSAQSGISGTSSDVNGINDQAYGGNAFAIYNAVISSFPPTDLSVLEAGASFPPLVTTAPTITGSLSTSSNSVSGTSTEEDGTSIVVYKNGSSIGSTTVFRNAWTLSPVSGLISGNLVSAKATASSRSQSPASNIVEVSALQSCYAPEPVMGAKVNGSQSMPGTWTMPDGSAIVANTVSIRLYQQTPGSNTFTEIIPPAPVYVSATTSGAGSFLFPTGLSQSTFNGTRLFATATFNGCTSGYSAASDVNSGSVLTPAPTIKTASALSSTPSNNIIVQSNYTASTIILYKNGSEIFRSGTALNNAATVTFSVSGLLEGDRLTARSQGSGASDILSNESNVLIVAATTASSIPPVITNTYIAGTGKMVTGTSFEIAGTTIFLYKTVSGTTTLIGTTVVNAFGNWLVSGLTLTSGDVLTAKADAAGKALSEASAPLTVQAGVPSSPLVNSPIFSGAGSVSGSSGNTLVKVYVDGSPLPNTSNLATWSISTAAGELYKGAKIRATNTVNTIESAFSNEVTVTGVDNFLVQGASGGNIGTQTAGVPFNIKITARDKDNVLYANYAEKNTVSSAANMLSGAGPTATFSSGVLAAHSVVLTKAGTYMLTTVSTTDPTMMGTSNSFAIDPAAASLMEIFQQPSATATGGSAFSQQPVIYLYDAYGNLATNDNTTQVTASIASGSGTIAGTVTRTAVNGVVSFINLAILGSGAHTLSFSSTGKIAVTSGVVTLTGTAAPSSLSYPSPNVYTVSQAISDLVPSVTGAVASYSISPGLPAGLSFDTTTGVISGTPTAAVAEGTYVVTASNGGGTTTFGIVIAVNATLEIAVTAQTNVTAFGGSTGSLTVLGTGGTGPYEYKIGNGAYQSATSFTGLTAGTYTITVKDRNNVTATVSATLTGPSSALSAMVSSTTDNIIKGASGGAIDLTVSGGTAPYTYSWTNGATTEDLTGLAAGSYGVTVTDYNGITIAASASITEPSALLSVSVSPVTNVAVFGASTGILTVSGTGGTAPYEYKIGNGAYQSATSFTGLAAGTYTITVKDRNNVTATVAATVTGPSSALSAMVSSTTGNIVKGASAGAIDLTVSGGTAPYTYSWTNGATTEDLTGLAAGSYNVTVTDYNGITTTASASITEPSALLSVSVSSVTNVAVFGASTGGLTVLGTGGTGPYEYKIGNGAYQSATSFTGLTAGTYTITVKDRNNVTATVSATLTGPSSALSVAVTSQTNVAIFGASTGSVTVEGSGGVAPYEYKLGNGSFQSGRSFTGLAAGTYTVNVKDAAGSISSITVTISQPSKALSLVVTSKRNVSVYSGSNGEIILSANGGTQPYEYKLDNGPYRESPSFDGLRAKTYIATVKDANGALETVSFVIEQPEQLAVALEAKANISGNGLAGSTIKLKATGGVSPYLYKVGDGEYQSSDTFENLRPGRYIAFVKDSYNVVQTLVVTVSGAGIPNVFTPNGDGKNDTFLIAGIENYDRVELTVFNRWGSEVYRAVDYDNKWEGAGLNSGTYYYVIKLIKDSKEDIRKGWVLLKK